MAARITDIFPILLITVLCLGLVEGGYQALEYFVLKPPAETVSVPDTAVVEKNAVKKEEQKEKHDYQTILERNLFGSPSKKEESAVATDPDYAENLQLTTLNIVLMGTISGGEGSGRAIILDKSSNKQELYEVGDVIQEALIKEILRGKVILAYNGKDEMLDMSEAANVRSKYAGPAARVGVRKTPTPNVMRSPRRPAVSPSGTPRRVINRPRAIRPTRTIKTQ